MARAICMSKVTVTSNIFHVTNVYGDSTCFLLWSLVNFVIT